jgi:hypothetical protein
VRICQDTIIHCWYLRHHSSAKDLATSKRSDLQPLSIRLLLNRHIDAGLCNPARRAALLLWNNSMRLWLTISRKDCFSGSRLDHERNLRNPGLSNTLLIMKEMYALETTLQTKTFLHLEAVIRYRGARGGAVGWGTALQTVSVALWPWGRLSL